MRRAEKVLIPLLAGVLLAGCATMAPEVMRARQGEEGIEMAPPAPAFAAELPAVPPVEAPRVRDSL
jgi:hypothetical protein